MQELASLDTDVPQTGPKLAPLVLATMASQALLVALSPMVVAVGKDLGASVGAVGQARSVAAGVAIIASLSIVGRVDGLGVAASLSPDPCWLSWPAPPLP